MLGGDILPRGVDLQRGLQLVRRGHHVARCLRFVGLEQVVLDTRGDGGRLLRDRRGLLERARQAVDGSGGNGCLRAGHTGRMGNLSDLQERQSCGSA